MQPYSVVQFSWPLTSIAWKKFLRISSFMLQRKNVIQVSKDMRVSKHLRNFLFWVNYSFNTPIVCVKIIVFFFIDFSVHVLVYTSRFRKLCLVTPIWQRERVCVHYAVIKGIVSQSIYTLRKNAASPGCISRRVHLFMLREWVQFQLCASVILCSSQAATMRKFIPL